MTGDNSTDGLSRRKYLTAAGAVGTAALAGCTGGGGGGSNKLEIAHWWAKGDGNKAINNLVDGFEEKYPDVKLDENLVAGGAGSALRDNIRTRIQNENPPSTFQTWPGKELNPFVEADLLEDIGSSVWEKNDMKNAYLEGPKKAAKPGGNFVTVPLNIHRLNNLFFNVEVVESAGVDPSSLNKPSDLVAAMKTIDEGTDAAPMAQQTKKPWSTLQLWAQVLMGEHGVDTYMAFTQGKVSANADAIKDSLDIVEQYHQYFNADAGSLGWTKANSKVINGDAAFMHQGDWAAGAYRGADSFEYGNQWDQVTFPGTDGAYALNMDSFPMPTNNPSPEATKKFLRYVGSVDGQERFNPLKGSIPPRTDVPDDEFGPFLTEQKSDFANSDVQPPSITHGLAVPPETLSNLKSAVSTFVSNWDVDETFSEMKSAFS